MSESLSIQLGDIIELISPSDPSLDNHTFYIKFIDKTKIVLVEKNGLEQTLTLDVDGKLDNESITGINILSRADSPSYARQNDLLPGKWIDIYFGGDIPTIITGEITNLEEDMIEITTYPAKDIIFIDFAYKGIPEDIPIIKINKREKVAKSGEEVETETKVETVLPEASTIEEKIGEASMPIKKSALVTSFDADIIPESEEAEAEETIVRPRSKIESQIRELFINADQIQFGEEIDEITQTVDLPESEQRFSLEKQTTDLLDELLSTIPNIKRTDTVLNNIHTMIERFKQLRKKFSNYDKNGNLISAKTHGVHYKPLIETLTSFNQKLYWILPVVKNMKKIYDHEGSEFEIEGSADVIPLTLADSRKGEENVIEQYKSGNVPEQDNKYSYLLKNINPYLTPFDNNMDDTNNLAVLKVNTNIAAIVDNLGDFYSTVMTNNKDTSTLRRQRFVIQEYNLGINMLDIRKLRGGDTIVNKKTIIENDTMVLNSLLLLPEVTVRFSRINLPYTNIMMKSNLNEHFLNYWQMLKNKTNVTTTVIDKLDKPLDYEKIGFLNKIQEIKLDDALQASQTANTYNKYLDVVVPKTRFLFNLIKPYINDNLTLHDVISYLEPFMVYQDDLTFTQYQEMIDFISSKIGEHKKSYLLKVREYNSLKSVIGSFRPKLINLFDTKHSIKEAVLNAYGLNDAGIANMSSEEFLTIITNIDCGRLYNTAIALIGSNLMIVNGMRDMNDISKYLKKTELNKGQKGQKGQAQGQKGQAQTEAQAKCSSYRSISKRYIALDELQDDNSKDIYFDKKYDTTYYDLLAEYKKPDASMSNDAYIGFLINNLIKKNGLNEETATREANAMLLGKRLIEDGDYAILESSDSDNSLTIQYYRRQNNIWVLDDSISTDVFEDKLKMICNLDEKCIEVKGDCETIENGGNEIKEANLKLVLKEFDEQLNVNKAVIVKRITDDFDDAMKRMNILLDLIHTHTYKNNYKQYNLGISIEEVDIIRSPYIKLRDVILGQADYLKRQHDIITFVTHFAREPLATEDTYWLYCVKTNTKLLPTFINKLAGAFVSNDNYLGTIEKICTEQGSISDDGDCWVDKHSGYIIRKISLNVEEEFTEEGYKNITRAVLEADLGESILQLNKPQKKFVDPESEKISNIIKTLSNFMGINVDSYTEFIIRNVIKIQETKMPNETAYNKMLEVAATKGKKNLDDFKTAYYQFLIFSTLSYLFIAIQASIPSIRTRKTHPGCIKSFSGFPMGGAEDMTGITYLSCIVNKIKSPIEHWKAIQKMNVSTIAKRIETQITKFILTTEDVQELIKTKQNYLLINVEDTIPDEHNIANMVNFLPPLVNVKMGTILNVTEAFNKELLDTLRKGSIKQNNMIDIVRGKIIQFSFCIIELIQKTVHKKAAIMFGNTGEPFLENACCESVGNVSTIKYFIDNQPEIETHNYKVKDLAYVLYDVIRMGKAGIYFDPLDTKNVIPALPMEFSEETIYKAFIVFCKYGNNLPISESLKAICMNKPDNFNDKNSLSENIRKLKGEGRNYSQETFQQLLTVVNNNNIVDVQRHTLTINTVQALKDVLTHLEQHNVLNIPTAFTGKFMNILDQYEINGLVEDTPEMRLFQNYLAAANDSMLANINDFVKRSPVIKEKEFKFFKECIDSISEFQDTGDNMVIDSQDETVFKMMSFIKNTLRCLTREFPNIIINKVDNASVMIPLYWKLSAKHVNDLQEIINKHYVSLYEFYDDEDVANILKKYMTMSRDIDILASLTEFYAPLEIAENKIIYSTMEKRLVIRLFKFYFYSTLSDLISLKDNDDILIKTLPKEDLGDSELMTASNAFSEQNGDITELEIISGENKVVEDKIAKILNAFINIICNDKKVINYNYKSMMDKVLRSKEKEKDDITSYLKTMSDEEREVENIFKKQQLERWNKGLQKGLVSYQQKTYDDEREAMEKTMITDSRLSKNKDVSEMNRDIYAFDFDNDEQASAAIEEEENRITYMGEDADYDELGLDGDEEFD